MTTTDQDAAAAADRALVAIRTEWERSISDAYAGGPTGRDRVWNRLLPLIAQYADAKAAAQHHDETTTAATDSSAAPSTAKHEDSSPILMSQTAATAESKPAATEAAASTKPKPPTKPTARKATAS